MNNLITIREVDGQKSVNARELHAFLESKQEFTTWINKRIRDYKFEKGNDFTTLDNTIKRETGATKRLEYFLSLDMAKEISMVERNDKGQQARRYFIECEKQVQSGFQIPSTLSEALLLAGDLAKQIEDNKPKVEFAEKVASSKGHLTIQQFAATLNIKGFGQNKMFQWLRENRYLTLANIPYRQYIDQGYFKVREGTRTNQKGEVQLTTKTLVTGKGQVYLAKRLI